MPVADDAQRNKRLAIIGVSTFLLVAMVIGVTVTISSNKNVIDEEDPKDNSKSHVSSTMKAVISLCQPTDYREECVNDLSKEAGNTTDPRELIQIAFQITINRIGEGLKKTNILQEVEKDPRAKGALVTCKQLMDLSVGEFNRSLDKLGKFNLNNLDNILTSLKVWLSGAVTYQETCLDAFENTTSEAGNKMKEILQTSMHMSSNGLAIINELSKTLASLHITKTSGRRLLQDADDLPVLGHGDDDLPEWVEDGVGVRRLLKMNARKYMANVIVAKDGSGNFTKISEALKLVPKKNQKSFIIWIKEGVYHEYVHVTKDMTHVVFVGDGAKKTRITGNKNFIDGINTYNTATVAVQGDYFVGIGVGFENSAGAHKHQAVALRVQADKSIFYKCRMDGFQDTLYAHALRQFYRDCTISGTIDFVFGDAVAVFQNCTFVVRKPMQNQQCIVTAQGRKERYQPSGIIIQGGSIVADPKYYPVRFDNKAYLARPWKNFSRTVFLETYIGDLIQPDGFMPWQTATGIPTNTDTCFYAEVNNRGPGADITKRVKWEGVKKLTPQIATSFFPSKFFHGDDWIRVTKIPYFSGEKTSKE
ncbi:hypothetical protein TanjilG_22598 [Lupinus angustifolius]|uniref:Pectinesterase n=1 Tax=Lupinus angustifolius TaxID=3871 RepID=A0A4P1RTF6_LUPAN|nr:PREDICTED: putative pectinesterase/pectinesterase inhibitor 28 [Lupinus angustifolius]XP_019422865.1 PREDICTED: putative pectinesterase/pectinesterase inhibitor 28 [Lupinus angustifolius]XP_019422873.1 PREDICTED: putative pectinesterase/pectinesterase inhibitor 28 [Lupinus angustifolius]OIW17486.1 hypothetical protein TanjilG_22598 [Lupinus angustifolius]